MNSRVAPAILVLNVSFGNSHDSASCHCAPDQVMDRPKLETVKIGIVPYFVQLVDSTTSDSHVLCRLGQDSTLLPRTLYTLRIESKLHLFPQRAWQPFSASHELFGYRSGWHVITHKGPSPRSARVTPKATTETFNADSLGGRGVPFRGGDAFSSKGAQVGVRGRGNGPESSS